MTSNPEAATSSQVIEEHASFVLAKRDSLTESAERISFAHLAESSYTTLLTASV
jgi:hypothetical protein